MYTYIYIYFILPLILVNVEYRKTSNKSIY